VRSRIFFVLFGLAAFAAGIWGFRLVNSADSPASSAPPARDLRQVSFPDVNGTMRTLSEWSGKVLIVNFWATWCPPCKEEMPEFDRLQTEFGAKGIQFIGIALDEPQDVRAFLQRSPVGYPILIGEPGGAAWAEELGNGLQVLPFTAVFDAAGRLAQAKAGPYTRRELVDLFDRLGKRE
jgi:thiol-disulfide isomerase/thioredoxin